MSKARIRFYEAIKDYYLIAFLLCIAANSVCAVTSYVSTLYVILFIIFPALHCILLEVQYAPGRYKLYSIAVMYIAFFIYIGLASFLNEILIFSSIEKYIMKGIGFISYCIFFYIMINGTYRCYKKRKVQRQQEERSKAINSPSPLGIVYNESTLLSLPESNCYDDNRTNKNETFITDDPLTIFSPPFREISYNRKSEKTIRADRWERTICRLKEKHNNSRRHNKPRWKRHKQRKGI